ncbi:MAG: YbaN family protein [Candidatus Eisenbacteria bacterium]|nr:YbaN family protein [Candidatus Eisenbacteria bacterium]
MRDPVPGRVAVRSPVVRHLLVAAGLVCVGLGVAGVLIPLLPTTPFLLLAAACFARSSDRFYNWLMNNRWMGDYVRYYVEYRATTLATKVGSIATLWCVLGLTFIFFTQSWVVRSLLVAVGAGVTLHLLSLKTIGRATAPGKTSKDKTEDAVTKGSVQKGRA